MSSDEIDPSVSNDTSFEGTTVDTCPFPAPVLTAPVSVPSQTDGLTASYPIGAGHTAEWSLSGGAITGGQGTGQVTFHSGDPGTTMVLAAIDSIPQCASSEGSAPISVDFLDVPPDQQFHDFVNTIARNRITAGCGTGETYCPDASVTRGQMAVFLLKALLGADHVPPAATGIFTDVPADYFAIDWIEDLYGRHITGGCQLPGDPLRYCPDEAVTREQMAVFLLKTLLGADYPPPPATGIFEDVPADSIFIDWIEDIYNRQITAGCQPEGQPLRYCPGSPNTRGEMAVFLTKTFGLQ